MRDSSENLMDNSDNQINDNKNKVKSRIIKIAVSSLLIVSGIFGCVSIFNKPVDKVKGLITVGDGQAVVDYYNSHKFSDAEKTEIKDILYDYICNIREQWDSGNTHSNSLQILKDLSRIADSEIVEITERQIKYITAEEYISKKDYSSFVAYYNEQDFETEDQSIIDKQINEIIVLISDKWNKQNISFEECTKYLKPFTIIDNVDIKCDAEELTNRIFLNEYLTKENIKELVDYYNNHDISDEIKKEIDVETIEYIDDLVLNWIEEKAEYTEVQEKLSTLTMISDTDISSKAASDSEYIKTENSGNILLDKAQKYYNEQNYLEAMKCLDKASEKYSQYDSIKDIYDYSRDELLFRVENPQTVDEYNKSIALLNTYIKQVNDSKFVEKRDAFKNELSEYMEIYNVLMDATDYYEKELYSESFKTLEEGLEKHPEEEKIKYALSAYQYAYIVNITEKVIDYTEQKEYDTARELIEKSIEVYDCDEFQELLKEVRMKSDFLYATSVKLSDAGYYIYKSGKKLLMGDFAPDEKETLLSLGGNITASIFNVDIPLDIRDLAYDMSHWGEGEYFGAKLALDAVGVLPLIGAIKYVKHLEHLDALKPAVNIIDNAADAVDIVDDVHDVLKPGQKLVDVSKIMSDVRKKAATISEKATDLVKPARKYEVIKTNNQSLLGKVHPKTGVKFSRRKIELKDGRRLVGVFPEFDYKIQVQLPENYYKQPFSKQKEYLSDYLKKMYETSDGKKKLSKIFTSDELDDIKEGIIPEAYLWHHNEKEGLMQLVDAEIHAATNHTGGMSIWGIGY